MTRKLLLIPWVVAIAIAILGPNEPFSSRFLLNFITYNTNAYEGYSLSLFSILGVYPLALFPLLWSEVNQLRPNPLLPAATGFAVGGFIIAPYLAFARQSPYPTPIKPLPTRLLGVLLLLVTIGLFIAASTTGNVTEYWSYVKQNQFVRTMTVDFFLLAFIQVSLMNRDAKRYKMSLSPLPYIPLFGLLFWLIIRHKQPFNEAPPSRHKLV
ncbi:hypothetical protein [Exiguobacterium sp. AM39-5BH]|uniref:hypothetical protein n=1 Tax=Exiguobacterium sp. AM39-5BH TaxID=2292355 RepID=UPI000FE1F83D|nr:hypothetical protein [Exiguobacterium sp. AM39-5BH]RHB46742.1 hypothetical protein DW881_13550 [Exiguobacterium sp. AM39-5BH]